MNSNDRGSKPRSKRKRRLSKEWTYEIVQADEPLDIEGLADVLARMILNYYKRRDAGSSSAESTSNPHSDSE